VDVTPLWADTMQKTAQIGNHVFYRPQTVASAAPVRMEGLFQRSSLPELGAVSEEIQPQVQIAGAEGNGA
jgi:hypothetical protein